jgi:hypothetical protein
VVVEPRSVGIALVDGLCDLGRESLQLKASMIGEGGPCPFELYPGFALQMRKSTETSVRVVTLSPTLLCFYIRQRWHFGPSDHFQHSRYHLKCFRNGLDR